MKFISDRGSKKRRLTLLPTVGLLLSATMLVVVAVVVVIISISALLPLSYGQQQNAAAIDSPAPCITYDSTDKIITITCDSARLTDIDNQIKDANILHKETTAAGDGGGDHGGVWLLNAGIVVAEEAVLYINSTDTTWLKIIPDDETTANGIEVHGSLKIDSVKITSWNPELNDYVKFKVKKIPPDEGEEAPYDKIPRPFIRVEHGATGTTDITNSELAYLGYEVTEGGGGGSGLNYYGGDGSIIRGN